jgi:hypothetical protein
MTRGRRQRWMKMKLIWRWRKKNRENKKKTGENTKKRIRRIRMLTEKEQEYK